MAERPIIFSASMVRALLEGRKTQTRRLAWRWVKDRNQRHLNDDDADGCHQPSPWQRVKPGDLIWVREAVQADEDDERFGIVRYLADGFETRIQDTPQAREDWLRLYTYRTDDPAAGGKTVPPIHMPRSASGITLRVTTVRVERLQDISEPDAIAEGLECLSKDQGRVWKWGLPGRDGLPGADDGGWPWTMWCIGHKPAFASLWDSLHGPDAWAANPEVVVMHFDVLHGNIDWVKALPASSLDAIRAVPRPEPGALATVEGAARDG